MNCDMRDGEFIINQKQSPMHLTPEIFVPLYIHQRKNNLPLKDIEYTMSVISRYVYAGEKFDALSYLALGGLASLEGEQAVVHPAVVRLFSGYLRAYLKRERLTFEELYDIYNFIPRFTPA